MNYLDIILGALLLWGFVRGFMKGLFASLASLVALVVGLYVAVHFSDAIGNYLFGESMDKDNAATKLGAFAITFVIVIILVTLAGKVLTKIADFAHLGIVNKLLGAAFGVLKLAFIASAVIMLIDAGNRSLNIIKQETIEASILYTPVKSIAPLVLPKIINQDKETNNSPVI